jgi:hypothetical protein
MKTSTKKSMNLARIGLMFAAAAISSFALATPSFKFTTDAKMNLMASGNSIDISAYPKMGLITKKIQASSAVLVFKGNDAVGAYAFYDKALKSEEWKDSPDGMMAKGDAMKEGGAMDKGADMMAAGPVTKADMMMAEKMKMKDGSYHGFYSHMKNIISLTTKAMGGKVTVTLTIK